MFVIFPPVDETTCSLFVEVSTANLITPLSIFMSAIFLPL